ncbi:MAG: glycosyltransferase, partial [Nanopusillaceae archaeon]
HDMALDPFLYNSLAITDYKPEIEEWLKDHYKEITYTSLDDLHKKLEYYLTHDHIREELVQTIKEYLIANVYNREWLMELIETVYDTLLSNAVTVK